MNLAGFLVMSRTLASVSWLGPTALVSPVHDTVHGEDLRVRVPVHPLAVTSAIHVALHPLRQVLGPLIAWPAGAS